MADKHSETKQPSVSEQSTTPVNERPLIADLAQRLRGLRLGRRIRRLRILDLIIIGVIVAAAIGGLLFLGRQTVLSRESASARVVTDEVVANIARQNTAAIRSLGTKQFQSEFDKADLTKQLRQFAVLYGKVTPAVDGRLITNNSKRQYVAITYRYDLLKVPFYVRVDVTKPAGGKQWQVQAISTGVPGSSDNTSSPNTQSI